MKTLVSTVAIGSAVAAALLLACASDEEPAAEVLPTIDAASDTSPAVQPPDAATDAGVVEAGFDARLPFDAALPEITCAVTPCMKKLVGGPKNYCATASDGVVRCWGDPTALGGFVDGGDPNAGASPVALTGLGDVVDVGVSNYDTCVASNDGGVSCFGSSSPTPKVVPSIAGAKRLAISDDRKCAALASGELGCWGDNWSTGTGETTSNLGEPVVSALVKWSTAFALGSKGTLFSWGNERYMLGRTSALSPDLTPAPVLGLPPVLQVDASDSHVCALSVDGRLFCWGRGADNGALGLGYVRHELFPVEVLFPGPAGPTQVAAAQTHSCARMQDGTLTCWANVNWFGELGYESTNGVFVPTKVTSLKAEVISVAAGYGSTCALVRDGSVMCWGDNSAGQLGRSKRDTNRHPLPARVVFP